MDRPHGALSLRRGGKAIAAAAVAAALITAWPPAGAPSHVSGTSCALSEARPEDHHARTILAEMTEDRNYIRYGTDFGGPKDPRELEREEKEKEQRSWEMLERMEIYQFPDRHRQKKDDRRY